MIGIIDYGAGNLLSVKKALDFIGADTKIIAAPEAFFAIDQLVLPGVGAFGAAVDRLKSSGLFDLISDWILADRPFLGICLGLQLLFEHSEESPDVQGFGLIEGTVTRFQQRKVPQMGWNQVRQSQNLPLYSGIRDDSFFYFLHSYYVRPDDPTVIAGETHYGITYTSTIQKGNMIAVQFHPEKSGANGLCMLNNWLKLWQQ